jgi:proteasome accessory factor C
MKSDAQRLKRLLMVVPMVLKTPGISVDDLAKALGTSREQLLPELDSLLLIGKPPFQPDDFLDLHVEDDRVYVDLDLKFSRAPNLTVSECVALLCAAQIIDPAQHAPLKEAIEAVRSALPSPVQALVSEYVARFEVGDVPSEAAMVVRAQVTRRELEFSYRGKSRVVRPSAIFQHQGHWYLYGFCLSALASRHFRLDAMTRVVCTERAFQDVPDTSVSGQMQAMFSTPKSWATVRFSGRQAAVALETWPQALQLTRGIVEVQVPADNVQWLVSWVLSFGGDAELVAPQQVRDAVLVAAQRAAIAASH